MSRGSACARQSRGWQKSPGVDMGISGGLGELRANSSGRGWSNWRRDTAITAEESRRQSDQSHTLLSGWRP